MEFAILDYMPVSGRYKAAILNYSEGGTKPLDGQTLYDAMVEVSALGWHIIGPNPHHADNCEQYFLQRERQPVAAIQQAADLKASLADYENTMMVIIEMTSGSLQRRIATEVDKAMERKDRALAAADRKTDGSEREGG